MKTKQFYSLPTYGNIAIFRYSCAAIFVSICLLCSSFSPKTNANQKLFGTWRFSYDPENNFTGYLKATEFDEEEAGIQFKADGKIVKRQNVGWCGTPPIEYANYKGTWKQTTDSTITIRYDYWGGIAEQDWLVVQLDDQKLVVEKLDYRQKKKEDQILILPNRHDQKGRESKSSLPFFIL